MDHYVKVILTTGRMNILEQIKSGVSAIDLGNCTEVLKEYYNISKEQDLIMINKESDNNDNSNNLAKYNQLDVFDFSGRKLNLSVCNEEIKVIKYIGDIVEELNFEEASSLAEWGIDIYNASSEFFNDLCYEYESSDGRDITMEDRRNDVYQNLSLCQDGCSYGGIDYELMIVNCICSADSLQSEPQNNTYDGQENKSQFKELVKSFIANWLDFNIDVIFCYNLVFNGRIIKSNIGFIFMSCMFGLQIIYLCIFLIKKLKPIKEYMKSQKPDKKVEQAAPPKKNKDDDKEGEKKHKKHKHKHNKDEKKNDEEQDNKKNKSKKDENEEEKEKENNSHKKNKNDKKRHKHNKNKNALPKLELSSQNFLKSKKDDKNIKSKAKVNNMVPYIYKSKNNLINDNFSKLKGFTSSKEKVNDLDEININIQLKKNKKKSKKEKSSIKYGPNNISEKVNDNGKGEFTIKLSQMDEDLQGMEFQDAVNEDKRSYLRMYWCFLVDSQTILGTFFTENYLDLLIINIILLFILLTTFFHFKD